jgi:hypothetical protein
MSDTGGARLIGADRVRVSRKSTGGPMTDTGGAPVVGADRVRVSRKTQEAR